MTVKSEIVQNIARTEHSRLILAHTDQIDQADRSMLQQVAAGEEKALTVLYEKYGQRLYAYAYRLTGDAAQAEDLLQDTLVVVWQSAGRFRGEGRVIAWLLGIVHHQALKSMRHRPQPLTADMEEKLSSTSPLPEEVVQTSDQAERVRKAIKTLSSEHREVLELIFFQKLSYEEAARVINCPVGTVKSRINHARLQMRGLLNRLESISEVDK
jgi:RNA polymerase sigma-70 factor (ECF subfamily)